LNREKILPATKSMATHVKVHPIMSTRGPVFSAATSGGMAGGAGSDMMPTDAPTVDVGRKWREEGEGGCGTRHLA
jgi:hypothetical protein